MSPIVVISIIVLYMGILFLIAMIVENRTRKGQSIRGSSLVYAASLAIYCTTWTYYGSVGKAVTSGPIFLTVYLGPTLVFIFGHTIFKRLVHLRNTYRITNIADLISARYDKSQNLAAIVTIICLIGISPYIALQLKAITSTYKLMVAASENPSIISDHVGFIVAVLMILFTIIFGVRRLDPTERHQGIVVAVAVESIFKLVTFLAVGLFITYGIYNGFEDIFNRFELGNHDLGISMDGPHHTSLMMWNTYMLLSMSAILFLPRQFHVTIVENPNTTKIRNAMWFFPLYMLLINIFVIPIALAGIIEGFPASGADTFVLQLPMHFNKPLLAIAVFLGGFSAGTSMVMISAMTLSTMIVNHLLLPIIMTYKRLKFLNYHLLRLRWLAVITVILLAYFFERKLGDTYTLVNIGMMSFAAALQFAPAVLASLFWRKGNKIGAMMGLTGGFIIWLYTLLIPSFAHSGIISERFVENGLFGLWILRPENLFGLEGLDNLSHSVFWSMFFNIGLFLFGSLFFKQSSEEEQLANDFVEILSKERIRASVTESIMEVNLAEKVALFKNLLMQYYSENESDIILKKCLIELDLEQKRTISVISLAELQGEVEKVLAGAIGSAIAHKVIRNTEIFLENEAKALQKEISEALADLRMTPEGLVRRIDFFRERESLLTNHANELQAKLIELEEQIKKRQIAQQALRESEEKYRLIIENSMEGIYIHQDLFIRFCNERFANMLGYDSAEELVGTHIKEISGSKSWDKVHGEVKQREQGIQEVSHYNLFVRRKDGSEFEVEVLASIIEYEGKIASQGVVRDISEKRILEDRLRQAQKMEAVGRLAGGVAHDFNNILTAISGYADLALLSLEKENPSYSDIESIITATERAADLTRQLLAFSRKQVIKPKIINVRNNILEMEKMLRRLISENINLEFHLDDDLWKIQADPSQIEQIIINLAVNSKDAMPDGGKLIIKAENVFVDSNLIKNLSEIESGSYVKISVSDTGVGISEEGIEHLFEPFYTTKDVGKGTGLGLATVYGIVKQNNGTIKCYSDLGLGTTFNVFLPAANGDFEEHEEVVEDEIDPSGTETILLVEDEDFVRNLAMRALSDFGYKVHESSSSTNAIEMCRQLDKKIDLILTDVIMPEINGPDMVREIKKIIPDVKVLFMSGYPREVISHQGKLEKNLAFISKPFRPMEVCQTVRKVIDGKY